MSDSALHHARLKTTFRGIRHPISSPEKEISQFRGIKYADVSGRFRQSTLHETFPLEYDATQYGPKCPQAMPIRMEDALIGLPSHVASNAPDVFDEFNCLNLNITVPAGSKAGDGLPIMAYVHGGGGFSGSNSDWWCDGGSIVKRSVEIGKPIIMVAINYRLTVFGYMGSEELGQVNGKENTANFGQRDIYTALRWISKNISPFGGSPSRITIYGESHGANSAGIQLHSTPSFPPVFHRAVMQSQMLGAPLFLSPVSLEFSSSHYTATKTALNISSFDELEKVPWQKLLEAYQKVDPRPNFGQVAVIDNIFFADNWAEALKGRFNTGDEEVIVGCTGNESAVFKMLGSGAPKTTPRPPLSALTTSLSPFLGEEKLTAFLKAYGLDHDMASDAVAEKLLQVVEDLCWYRPVELFVTSAKKMGVSVREYSFEQRQPFGGPFKGVSSHSLDLAYLHGSPSIFDTTANPEQELKVQRAIQDAWIGVAYGDKGWKEDEVRIFGPEGKVEDLAKERFVKGVRRGGSWDIWEGVPFPILEGVAGTIAMFTVGLIGMGEPAAV